MAFGLTVLTVTVVLLGTLLIWGRYQTDLHLRRSGFLQFAVDLDEISAR